jgi:hypothetical protein
MRAPLELAGFEFIKQGSHGVTALFRWPYLGTGAMR